MTTKSEGITLLPYRERVKLVQERMRGLRAPKTKPLNKPARVTAAETVWREWEAKNEAHVDAQRDAHRAKLREIQDALIVGDMVQAVMLLQRLGA